MTAMRARRCRRPDDVPAEVPANLQRAAELVAEPPRRCPSWSCCRRTSPALAPVGARQVGPRRVVRPPRPDPDRHGGRGAPHRSRAGPAAASPSAAPNTTRAGQVSTTPAPSSTPRASSPPSTARSTSSTSTCRRHVYRESRHRRARRRAGRGGDGAAWGCPSATTSASPSSTACSRSTARALLDGARALHALHRARTTGTLLLRARAVENQCFVIAAAQYGRHNDKRGRTATPDRRPVGHRPGRGWRRRGTGRGRARLRAAGPDSPRPPLPHSPPALARR